MVNIRRALYRDMFLIAKQNASLSKQARETGNKEEELQYSLVTIIMTCCCLEAFINTYAMQKHWDEWDTYERKPIKYKWLKTLQEYSNGAILDTQGRLYLEFSNLVNLRNSLVHYKVKPTRPIKSDRGVISEQDAELTASKAEWAVETTERMIEEFCELTSQHQPDWLGF